MTLNNPGEAESCKSCFYFLPTEKVQIVNQHARGFCRRFPPTAIMVPDKLQGVAMNGTQAPARSDMWCGEWTPPSTFISDRPQETIMFNKGENHEKAKT